MKTYNNHEVFDLIQPLINENLLRVENKDASPDFKLGILDANKRLCELQHKFLKL